MTQGKSGFDSFSLAGKVAVVTGGAGLIGGEITRSFVAVGASVAVIDLHSAATDGSLRTHLRLGADARCEGFACNIAVADEVKRTLDAIVARLGPIDIVVNCAAIDAKFDSNAKSNSTAWFQDFPLEAWERSVTTNVTGLFMMTRFALKHMVERRQGNIINVGSVYSLVSPDQGLYGDPRDADFRPKPIDYVATKSMVPNFTRYIAATYGTHRIRSNCIVPHGIQTDHGSEFQARFAQRSPLGRMCRLDEIGPPAIFLASDASSYVTGSTLVVDGGWTAW